MLEDDIEKEIVAFVESLGGKCIKLIDKNGNGFPDRTIFLPGVRAFRIEFKRPRTGRPSPVQLKWHQELFDLNHPSYIIDSTEDAKLIINYFMEHEKTKRPPVLPGLIPFLKRKRPPELRT